MKSLISIFSFFALLSINSHSETADQSALRIFLTINERLSHMEDVALYKAHKQLPIEDVAREQTVIQKAKKSAKEQGLSPKHIEGFFQAQIAVAKAIQYRYRADLMSEPTTRNPRDLKNEVRPELVRLGSQLVQSIHNHLMHHGSIQEADYRIFSKTIDERFVSDADKILLFNALREVRLEKPI